MLDWYHFCLNYRQGHASPAVKATRTTEPLSLVHYRSMLQVYGKDGLNPVKRLIPNVRHITSMFFHPG